MARVPRTLAVDLGSSSVKLGEFQFDSNGGLTLLNYGVQDMGLDPNKSEDKLTFYLDALQKLLTDTGIRPGPTVLGISGQSVFTRFIKLPPVAPEQLQDTIANEAQMNVPFQINEVVWDYQLLGSAGSVEIEGVIVAIKSDLVEEANAALTSLKLPVVLVDVSPLALINSFLFNYGTPTDSTLIVDIGAKTTNLVFIDGRRVFCRAIPIAGNMISQNICNEFQEPYVAAELLKKGKGFVGLGGAYADPDDPAAARISKISRSVFSRLHAEVTRSISFYRNQQGGNPPQRVLLTGGASAMAYSDLFFKDKLSIPVDYMNPMLNLGIAPYLDKAKLAQNAHYLGPLVGMALRRIKNCPIEVDLTPASVKQRTKKSARIPYLVGAVATALIAATIPSVTSYLEKQKVDRVLEQRKSELTRVKSLNADIKKSLDEFKASKDLIDSLKRLDPQRNFWLSLFQDINGRIPDGIWLTSFRTTTEDGRELNMPSGGSGARGSRRVAPAAGGPKEGAAPEILNLAPKPGGLNLKGIVEIRRQGQTSDEQLRKLGEEALNLVESFRASLLTSPYVESADIRSRDLPDPPKIGLGFEIVVKMKADKIPDTKP